MLSQFAMARTFSDKGFVFMIVLVLCLVGTLGSHLRSYVLWAERSAPPRAQEHSA